MKAPNAGNIDFSDDKENKKEKPASGLPKLNIPGVNIPALGGGSGGDININALADQQSAVVIQMTSALSNLMLAQQQFLEAFDLKEEALALQSDINNMKQGKNTPKKSSSCN